jgi:hypothetical protein
LQEGILRPDYEKELHQLNNAGKSSKQFEAFCQGYINLVLDLYSEAIDVPYGDIQLEVLKEFGDLHLEYGEIPNFPPVPPDNWLSTMELLSRISHKCILFHQGRSGEAHEDKSRSSLSQNLQ